MKAKFKPETLFEGRVRDAICRMPGRTKREAVVRLRREFRKNGISTMPDPLVDLLEVRPATGNQPFQPVHSPSLTRAERRARNAGHRKEQAERRAAGWAKWRAARDKRLAIVSSGVASYVGARLERKRNEG